VHEPGKTSNQGECNASLDSRFGYIQEWVSNHYSHRDETPREWYSFDTLALKGRSEDSETPDF
jgi:hypothetical protein